MKRAFIDLKSILLRMLWIPAYKLQVIENLELEVRADSVQPARLVLPITVIPTDAEVQERHEKEKKVGGGSDDVHMEKPRAIPVGDQLPVSISELLLRIAVIVLCFR